MTMTSTRLIAFVILAFVGGGVLDGCNQKEQQTQNEAKLHDSNTLHDLAVKYSAVQDWEKPLTNNTSPFTIDVQDALLNKSAPLEFTGNLVDIRRDGGHIVAVFTVSIQTPVSLLLRLTCTEDQRKILTAKGKSYAIIADVQKVVKQGDLTVDIDRDEDGVVDQTFNVDWDTDKYWLTGTCLDLKKLDD
jgi:hypothetical protein